MAAYLGSFKAVFDSHGIKFIIYIDGLAHPVKAEENASRNSIRILATQEFKLLALTGDPDAIDLME